jgi:N-formylglutamate deformylase
METNNFISKGDSTNGKIKDVIKMKKIVLHIPHSSVRIPYYDGYAVDESELKEEQLLLSDWYTDDIFNHDVAIPIIADFSRIFCDVERFEDDAYEIMSKAGMGMLYEKRDDGSPLRKVTPELRARIINDFYTPHHQKLTEIIENQLKQNGRVLIIDCHSFPDIPLKRDLNQNPDRPDYCIGTDDFHTPDELLKVAKRYFEVKDLTVGINSPYAGSIVPLKYFQKNKHLQTVMLEINRRLYLKERTNIKTNNYYQVKETVREFINYLASNWL